MRNNTQQVKISDVIAQLGIPANSQFLGYAVNRHDSEEFLMEHTEKDGSEKWLWAKTPQLAHLYQDYQKALSNSNAYQNAPTLVGLIFGTDNRLVYV